jgi:hypothetical protein
MHNLIIHPEKKKISRTASKIYISKPIFFSSKMAKFPIPIPGTLPDMPDSSSNKEASTRFVPPFIYIWYLN